LLYFGFFLFEITSIKEDSKTNLKLQDNFTNKTILNSFFLHKRKIVEVLLDFAFICIAYYAAYFLRFEDTFFTANVALLRESLPWIIIVKLLVFFSFGLYRGVWRYIGISDFFTIFKVVSLGSLASVLVLTLAYRFEGYSRAVFFIDWLLLLFLILGSRFLFRLVGEFLLNMRKGLKNILIFGAGDTGEMVIREIKKNKFMHYKTGSGIHGISVLGDRSKIKKLVKALEIKEVIIAAPTLGNSGEVQIINICQECGVEYRTIKGIFD
jgi:UDP-GlcNAc:undecaprenyl-phosphate GlcNAc-1-phosphate transferase